MIVIPVLGSVTLFVLVIIVSLNTALQHESMLLGMGLGVSTSPIMAYVIKKFKSKRKTNRMLKELRELMIARKEQEPTMEFTEQ